MGDLMYDLYRDLIEKDGRDVGRNIAPDEIIETLERFAAIWTSLEGHDDILTMIMVNYGFGDVNEISMEEVKKKYRSFLICIRKYLSLFAELEMHRDHSELAVRVHVAFQIMQVGSEMFGAIASAKIIHSNLGVGNIEPSSKWLRHYTSENTDSKDSDFRELVSYLNRRVCVNGLSRSGNILMRQVFTTNENGREFCTYAWRYYKEISDFCHGECEPDNHMGYELATRNGSLMKQAIQWMESQTETSFLRYIDRDRGVFSFRNGVYFAHYDYFVRYDDNVAYPLEAGSKAGLQPVACKFFDTFFNPHDDKMGIEAMGIPTPTVDIILNHQGFDVQTQRAIWIMIGRFLYKLNDKDRWEVALSFYGIRGTGKSKLINLISQFYDTEDVAVLSADMRKIQGLEGMESKFILTASDIKAPFWLDRTNFQVMTEGGQINIQGMYKKAKCVQWNVPMCFAFNENPWPDDPQGSVGRRQAIVYYSRIVRPEDIDPNIDSKISQNIANILLKANRLYLWACSEYIGKSFWDWCPASFVDARSHMELENNPWATFIDKSGYIERGEPVIYYVPMKAVVKLFKSYVTEVCSSYVARQASGNESSYLSAFAERGFLVRRVKANEALMYPHAERQEIHDGIVPKLLANVDVLFGADIIGQNFQ
jgi:hypothetical protein